MWQSFGELGVRGWHVATLSYLPIVPSTRARSSWPQLQICTGARVPNERYSTTLSYPPLYATHAHDTHNPRTRLGTCTTLRPRRRRCRSRPSSLGRPSTNSLPGWRSSLWRSPPLPRRCIPTGSPSSSRPDKRPHTPRCRRSGCSTAFVWRRKYRK